MMRYCSRCVLPESSAVKITFDEKNVCSGCRVAAEKVTINWEERKKRLREILEQYKNHDGTNYDCIIPVSGGKDSWFQTYYIKEVMGYRPLLVTFNHQFNTRAGIRNLSNLIKTIGVDHIRFTPNPKLIKKLSVAALKKMGDMCWHCHAGIFTYPVQIAVKFKIPLIVWGEIGRLDYGGMFSNYEMVEMTRKVRTEHSLRGYDVKDMFDEKLGITINDLKCFTYPRDEEIEEVGVRGIYLGNFVSWNAKKQTELMIKKYGFETAAEERTYNIYENVECFHCGGAHDYLKYLKYGYGRATDHVCLDIRLGRMTREEGIEMVKKYDHVMPRDLDIYLKWAGITLEEFESAVDSMRDKRAWGKDKNGKWVLLDHVANHINDPFVDEIRIPLNPDEKKEFLDNSKESKFCNCDYTLM